MPTATERPQTVHSDDAIPAPLAALRELAEQLRTVESVATALYWDERVTMPHAAEASAGRARQREHVTRHLHALRTSSEATAVLDAALAWNDTDVEVAAMTRELRRATRSSADLVGRTAAATARARHAWQAARVADDFAAFAPHLEQALALAREDAEGVGYEREPYEACLDKWERGIGVDVAVELLESLARQLAPVARAVAEAGDDGGVDRSVLDRPVAPAAKYAFERELLAGLGFDWTRGRMDAAPRAFCMEVGPGDVRMTTRLHEQLGMRFVHSSLHEAGHGIYAQALQRLEVPATIASAPGLGLDESQSRGFERLVALTPAFWAHHFPRLMELAGGVFTARDEDAFVAALAAPRTDLLRIDSIGPAYDLHVVLRMRLERAMVNGDLAARDLPDAWRAGSLELLGVEAPDDAQGCMQDVHWSIGQWGYFPTYSLGNVYSAALLERARTDVAAEGHGNIDDELRERGTTTRLLGWLDRNVYAAGCSHTSREIVERATGAELTTAPLLRRYGIA